MEKLKTAARKDCKKYWLVAVICSLVLILSLAQNEDGDANSVHHTDKNGSFDVPFKFFEEVKTKVIRNVDKNHMVTQLFLEDFYNMTISTVHLQMKELTSNLALVYQGEEFVPFYHKCIQNVKKLAPNLKKVHFGEARNAVVIGDNLYEGLKSEVDKLKEDAAKLEDLFLEHGVSIVDFKMVTEVVIKDVALNITELNDVFDSNSTSEFAQVYGFVSNTTLKNVTLQQHYVFSSSKLFNTPEDITKYKLLQNELMNSDRSRIRLEGRLPYQCVRPIMASSIICLASPERLMVSKREEDGSQIQFCCEFM
ncbi:unnamed protein product [Bursaphelenchus okinawaensis]|uniref:Uncharacterized protein n=1 Tax=Bursaphelenchus okinawaensis TaxID=465554 RepID=A0A811KBC8_9BILA|nr:unnamed protein product [Bursaphelenchus okinawaensis]CAG9096985.1 unnamed protein product [Bursaphelenchus okinawaensis]